MSSPTAPSVPAASFRPDGSSWIASAVLCLVTTCIFVGLFSRLWHWFVVATALGAILIGRDALDWIRGRLDVLDPVGVIGLYGLHYFLLAPFMHVVWDFWWHYRFNPLDWRPWLGYMALINFVGLIGYRITKAKALNYFRAPRTLWRISDRKFLRVMPVFLVVTALLQVWVYRDFGGVANYIHAYEDSLGVWGSPWVGHGWKFTISESFPVLSAISYMVLARKYRVLGRLSSIVPFLIVQFFLELVFGGIRGSRSDVIVGLFWTVGLIHMFLKPIARKQILVGLVVLFAYMNVYYFYKHAGLEGLQSITSSQSRDQIVGRKGIGNEQMFILLHDFSRADIQALALYLIETSNDYRYAYGRTYWGGVSSVIPSALWPNRPQTVRKERTELLYGQRSPSRHFPEAQVPWIFGAPGEAMLNFGPLAAPIPFLVWGFVVGWVASLYRKLRRDDSRALLLPMMIGLSLLVFIGDSHVFFMMLIKDGLVPFAAIWLISERVPIPAAD